VGAQMGACNEDSHQTWTCSLTRKDVPEWIVWNVSGDTLFTIPADWRAANATSLLGSEHPISGATIEINQVPQLLAQKTN
jgi:hypothetical protein